jgi:hypothetical protein
MAARGTTATRISQRAPSSRRRRPTLRGLVLARIGVIDVLLEEAFVVDVLIIDVLERCSFAVSDLIGAQLQVGGAHGGIEIEAGSLQLVDRFQVSLAKIKRFGTGTGDTEACGIDVDADAGGADHGQRVEPHVHHLADTVAQGGRAQQRQHQIRALADAPDRQCLAEVLAMARWHADMAADVDDAAEPHDGVEHEAAQGLLRALELALEQVVEEHHRGPQVLEKVVDAITHELRCGGPIHDGCRLQKQAVEHAIELEDRPIDGFERIVLVLLAVRWPGTESHLQQQESGHDCAHPAHHAVTPAGGVVE